jgi:uncharacterized membrane protein (DUF4010 family)
VSDDALRLAVALGIGLLLGAERERRMGRGPDRGAAGVRTFALVTLLGGLSARVGGEATLAVALAFVGMAAIAGYFRSDQADPGLTTEVALVVAFLLGALAQDDPELAAALGVAIAILLVARDWIHRLVRDTLSERELHDGLLFAACALVVLPLVPDEGLGPNDAFNPATVWQLVVIVMAVQGVGYIALRAIGPRYGLPMAGLLGGFVSSTATIGAMGARAAREPALRRAATAAAVASSVATIILLALVVGVVSAETLERLVLPLVLSGLAAFGYAALFTIGLARTAPAEPVDLGRAFDLRAALLLAAVVSAVLLAAGAVNNAAGDNGVVVATAIAGFADSQSAAISAASLASHGQISISTAVIATLVALTTNTISKAAVAAALGKRRFASQVWPGLVVILAAAWTGWLIEQAL